MPSAEAAIEMFLNVCQKFAGGSEGRRARLAVCVCLMTHRPRRFSSTAVPRPILSIMRPPVSAPRL